LIWFKAAIRTGGKSAVSCGSGACAGKIGAEAGAAAMPNVLLLWVSPTAALLGAARPLTWASIGAAVVGTSSCFSGFRQLHICNCDNCTYGPQGNSKAIPGSLVQIAQV